MSSTDDPIEQLWFTRCTVPTASGVAYGLGWLNEEFAGDGIALNALQDVPDAVAGNHHYSHGLVGLFREGGSIPAFWTRSNGAPTRLVGLTWVDERQVLVARPGSGVSEPGHLRRRRLALPAAAPHAPSIFRPMALHGFKNVLALAGLTLDDVDLVEVPAPQEARGGVANWGLHPELLQSPWAGIVDVAEGRADFAYIKGALPAEQAVAHGLEVVLNLDDIADAPRRVNNGTPRPITVHQELLDRRPDLVVRYLRRVLDAADWARDNLEGVRSILSGETGAGIDATALAYGAGFHQRLHPTLDDDRVALFEIEKRFLVIHGFVERDFDLGSWIDPEPLRAARDTQLAHAG